ncbi:hypothetical protein FDUTEX481_09308 [Tolypothrix sp. PCC 7601]|nr:hypothetical protein FDUTEX481_09308 [Tolypothrix sp. PCC 7601]BAY93329.1 hypothetical protein NIES3275_53680 [Microchaete diplosiphon NIES-3275]
MGTRVDGSRGVGAKRDEGDKGDGGDEGVRDFQVDKYPTTRGSWGRKTLSCLALKLILLPYPPHPLIFLIFLIFIAPLENFPYFSLPFAQFIFRTIFLHSAVIADAQNQRHLSDRYFGTILGTGRLTPLV